MKIDVNQDIFQAARQSDKYESAAIIENNVLRHIIHEPSQIDSIQTATDDEVLATSRKFVQHNKHVYEELAK